MGQQDALFVCLSEHIDDALKVIRGPSHVTASPVDADDFERALENPDTRLLAKWATVLAATVVVVVGGLIYLAWSYGRLVLTIHSSRSRFAGSA
jgi:hypothetical protein